MVTFFVAGTARAHNETESGRNAKSQGLTNPENLPIRVPLAFGTSRTSVDKRLQNSARQSGLRYPMRYDHHEPAVASCCGCRKRHPSR